MDQRELVRKICDKINGLSDLDWSELAAQSDTSVHPDHLRKMGAGIRLAMEAGMLLPEGQPPSPQDQ